MTTIPIPLRAAQRFADELIAMLRPYCLRVEVAGSIRRGKARVKDIELLCEPIVDVLAVDLWGTPVAERVRLYEFLEAQRRVGVLEPRLDRNGRPAIGERYQRLVYRGVALDLFICRPPAQFGLLYVIRTGPGEFSHRLVTQRRFGGLLPDGWHVRDGALHDAHGNVVETPDEWDVFRVLGLDWIPPHERRGRA